MKNRFNSKQQPIYHSKRQGLASHQNIKSSRKPEKVSKSKRQIGENRLFESNRLHPNHQKRSSLVVQRQIMKHSNKIITTDESNHALESNMHQSILGCQNKQPNAEYFQPLAFREKKFKMFESKKRSHQNSKLQNISQKIKEMKSLVFSQEKQVNRLKSSMSQKQLHRLLKMHNIEKLKLIEQLSDKAGQKQLKKSKGA